MTYLALARRYRPDDFSKILAQNHITKTLSNAISSKRISQAYLFCGPRGTGKTTTARVMAKSLNCKDGPTSTPCGNCSNCQEIKIGISPDVFEIDAASNRGIDDIRELRENVRYSPVSSRYKIYIIDEVHRLTQEAFDALLKTLEEPPSHVIFIFATTEPQKLPATILSRTQRFDFKRIPVSALAETINNVAEDENIKIEPKAALLIARKADGSLRDALSLLDQLTNFGDGAITMESTSEILGLIKSDFLFKISSAIINHDISSVLKMINIYFNEGGDIDELSDELSAYLGKMLMVKNGVDEAALLEMDSMELEKTKTLIGNIDTSDILRMLQIMNDYISAKKSGIDPVIAIEVALTRMAGLDRSIDLSKLLNEISGKGNPSGLPLNRLSKPAINNSRNSSFQSNRTISGNYKNYQSGTPENSNTGYSSAIKSGSHKLEDINKWWPNLLGFTKAKSMALWSHLQHLVVESVEKNIVNLGYTEEQKHHKNYLQKDKKFLKEILSEFCGNDVSVLFVKVSDNNNNVRNGLAENDYADISQNAEEILNQNPKIKKLIDDVDGDILGIN